MTKIYQQGSVPNMGDFNAGQNSENEGTNTGPKIEEVD
jgi:hypothetical protein